MSAHTAGPWWAEDSADCWRLMGGAAHPHAHGMQILKAPKHGTPYAEYWPHAADAALIVAAPDLLAACEALQSALDIVRLHEGCDCAICDALKQSRAAIAKARGEVQP